MVGTDLNLTKLLLQLSDFGGQLTEPARIAGHTLRRPDATRHRHIGVVMTAELLRVRLVLVANVT